MEPKDTIGRDIYSLRWQAVYLAAGHKNLKSFAAWIGVTAQHLHYVIFRERESARLWKLIVEKLGYDPRIEDGKELEDLLFAMSFGHPATKKKVTTSEPTRNPSVPYYQPGTGKGYAG